MAWTSASSAGRGSSTTIGMQRGGQVQGRGRGAAFSSNYDRQFVLHLRVSGPEDALIATSAAALDKFAHDKGLTSTLYSARNAGNRPPQQFASGDVIGTEARLKQLTGNSRLYLVGHGNWQNLYLADWRPRDLAYALRLLGMPAVKTISILGCALGRDLGTANDCRLSNSSTSFVGAFHHFLKQDQNLEIDVYGRVHEVAVAQAGFAFTPDQYGHKFTADDDDLNIYSGHRRAGSKIKFSWNNGTQVRTVV